MAYESIRQIGKRLAAEKEKSSLRVTWAEHGLAMDLKRRLAKGMSWQQVRAWLEAHEVEDHPHPDDPYAGTEFESMNIAKEVIQ